MGGKTGREQTALDPGEGENSRVIWFVQPSSGITLMETFGAWDRSQQQKHPPGLAVCPSYPWPFRQLAAVQGSKAVRGTGPLLSDAFQEASSEE